MANQVTLTFGGDADELVRQAARANNAVESVGESSTNAGRSMERAGGEAGGLTGRLGSLGAASEGASGAIGDAAGSLEAISDISNYAERTAHEYAQAMTDVRQAQEDANQAILDGTQAVLDIDQAHIDATQAQLDAKTAQQEYNDAVAEYGVNSEEASQASIDLTQANQDLKQANYDVTQAQADQNQATIDAEQAQLDLSEAQKAANPPDLQKWADQLNMVAPLLQAVVGVVALVTAAQWAWNAAQLASPVTWIVLGIVALIAVIVLIATKTDWFQRAWRNSWEWIKNAASNTVDFMKKIPGWLSTAFSGIVGIITWPYRTAFNLIADAWNYTIGSLHWTVPNWIPGIGGNSISVPNLPKFHTGGVIPGDPSQEYMALVRGGETIGASTPSGGRLTLEFVSGGTAFEDAIIEIIAKGMRVRGGDPSALNIRVVGV
jgi:hypothetical protein